MPSLLEKKGAKKKKRKKGKKERKEEKDPTQPMHILLTTKALLFQDQGQERRQETNAQVCLDSKPDARERRKRRRGEKKGRAPFLLQPALSPPPPVLTEKENLRKRAFPRHENSVKEMGTGKGEKKGGDRGKKLAYPTFTRVPSFLNLESQRG